MSSAVKLEELVEQLTLYAIAISGKDVTLISRDKLNVSSPELKIFLPPQLSSSSSRERNKFNYRMLTALQALVLRFSDDRIDLQSLGPLWRYGVRKVEQDYALYHYLSDPALPPHYKENFLDVLQVIEWGRVRQAVVHHYPALDQDINDYVLAECDLNDSKNQSAHHPALFHPITKITRSESSSFSPDGLNQFVKEFNTQRIALNRTLLEFEYLLLISNTEMQEKVKKTSSPTTISWFDTVYPVIINKNASRSDSVRLTFEIVEEFVYPKDYFTKGKSKDGGRRNLRTQHSESNTDYNYEDNYATKIFNLRRPLLWYLDESQKRLTEIKVAASLPAKDSRKMTNAIYVDEWNGDTQHYEKQLCKVSEIALSDHSEKIDQNDLFRFAISTKEAGEIKDILEILKPEGKVISRKRRAGELDLSAVIQHLIDKKAGLTPDDRTYQHQERKDRSVAHILLVDCSGSTLNYCSKSAMDLNMRIIDMIRYGIIHYSMAALELGDDCAIIAYNSRGRDQINVYQIMNFGATIESLTDVTLNLFRTKPQLNNHDGAALRYALYHHLLPHPAQTKLLIHLSDGLPSDDVEKVRSEMASWGSKIGDIVRPYVGEYAIADVKKALEECDYYGVKTCCLSFASEETRLSLEKIWGREYKMLKTPYSLGKKLAQVMVDKTLI